jgi:8-oxo-dGTP diphosphatase
MDEHEKRIMEHPGVNRQPIVVVAAVIERGGTVLLARRREGAPRGGLWEFPGGKVESDESDREALARELAEELGIDVVVAEPVGQVTHRYPDVTINLRAYACTIRSGEPKPVEHDECRWVGPTELESYPLSDADLPIARLLASRATSGRANRDRPTGTGVG